MDKKTITAIVLSVVIIIGAFAIQAIFFAPEPSQDIDRIAEELGIIPKEGEEEAEERGIVPLVEDGDKTMESGVSFSTNVFEGSFSSRGGNLTSLELRYFEEIDGSLVQMIVSGESERFPFNLTLDDYDTGDDIFAYTPSLLGNEFSFSRSYLFREGGTEVPFTITKKYRFEENEYLIECRVFIEAEGEEIPIEQYSLSFGPQIGPPFEKLDGRTEYRHYIYYSEGKRKNYTNKIKKNRKDVEDRSSWHAVEGHYFLVAGISYISDLSKFRAGFDATTIDGLPTADRSSLYFDRTVNGGISVDDGFKFYVGPKKRDVLSRYNDSEQNEFKESGLDLEFAVPSDFWGWLSAALKWLLELFYKLIPNWGVAIILLTIVIKIVFFPLTRKSFESNKKMSALGPKMEEIKKRNEGNTQKANQEIAELYKKEGVNPLGGCLPLLLQLPIFFALYSLFSNFFEFRGAGFIPPWIADLSAPESLLTLPFSIPLLGAELRLLPFIMLGSSFVQQWISQTPAQTSRNSKLLMYAMPAFFFFIMYNMPSGLLIYWTMQSLLTFATQFYINKHKSKKPKKPGDKK